MVISRSIQGWQSNRLILESHSHDAILAEQDEKLKWTTDHFGKHFLEHLNYLY